MIKKYNDYILESKKSEDPMKSIDYLETLTSDELAKLLHDSAQTDSPNSQYVKNIITVGCPIDGRAGDGQTALHYAAQSGNLKMMKFLIDHGADIHAMDDNSMNPLHYAAWNGNLEVVKFLVSKGADINSKSRGNYTPLLYAVVDGHLDVIEYLVSKRADVNARDDGGRTAWDNASDYIKEDVPKLKPKN